MGQPNLRDTHVSPSRLKLSKAVETFLLFLFFHVHLIREHVNEELPRSSSESVRDKPAQCVPSVEALGSPSPTELAGPASVCGRVWDVVH